MIGEEVYLLSGKNEWQIGTITGTTDTGRSYNVLSHKGTSLRRNRSHLKPRSHDIPIISQYFVCRSPTSSQSEITRNWLSRLQYPPKVKYFHNNDYNNCFQDHYEQHPPKVEYFPGTVPKLVIKHIRDTAYDSYISEALYPLKSAIKPKKQMRFAGDPVTSVKTIPARKTRPHPPKWTINAGDPDLLITLELSQVRAGTNLYQDLGGNLLVMSPRESHLTEETLDPVPLGRFQVKRRDNTTTNSIAHFDITTPSQSEIKSGYNNSSTITENIVPPETSTSSQREIFCETGTVTSSSKDMSRSDGDIPEEASHQTGTESKHEEATDNSCTSKTTTSSQSEIFLSYNNSSDC